MPTNVTYEYTKAEEEYYKASTTKERLIALQKMLSTCPGHKGAEVLRREIKQKISKCKELLSKEKSKKSGFSLQIRKEGAAQISIIGLPNSGKSWLLNKLTGSNVKEASYPFTTVKPEIGTLDYKGIKLQIIEIPAFTKDFIKKEKGPTFFSIIRNSDLVIFLLKNDSDLKFLNEEFKKADFKPNKLIINFSELNSLDSLKEKIWKNLGLIKVYTKQPGKEKQFPPVALNKKSTVEDLAKFIHKDFIKKFKFARIWGKSIKFNGSKVGLDHILKDEDVVEFHLE